MEYRSTDDAVCAECFDDDYLKSYISANAAIKYCDYCGRRSRKKPISVYITEIVEHIREGLESEYNDAADEPVPYESAEDGYQFPTMSTYELLDEVGFSIENQKLYDRIVSLLPDYAWIQRNPLSLSPADSLRFGWDGFCQIIKHRVRYLLFPPRKDDEMRDEVRPEDMLEAIGEIVTEINLATILSSGTKLYRVRIHEAKRRFNNALELGPPPSCEARYANRMSPAGISMFYTALDKKTALAETYVRKKEDNAKATVAIFELIEDLPVLNLTQLPEVPSIFADEDERWKRPGYIFLHRFLEDFTKPVIKDGREHIDYVPSQVVTEYFRYRYKDTDERLLRGILYPSSRVNDGKACVLFVSYEDCANDWTFGEPMKAPFRLVSKQVSTIA